MSFRYKNKFVYKITQSKLLNTQCVRLRTIKYPIKNLITQFKEKMVGIYRIRPKQNICVVPVARPCRILTPDPKHFCLYRIQKFFLRFGTSDFFSGSPGFYLTRQYGISQYQFSKQKWRRSYDHIVYCLAK